MLDPAPASDHQRDERLEHEANRGKDGQIGLAELSLQHDHGHLADPEALRQGRLNGLDLAEVGLVDVREEVDRTMVPGSEAAGDVREALAVDAANHAGEDVDPDPSQR